MIQMNLTRIRNTGLGQSGGVFVALLCGMIGKLAELGMRQFFSFATTTMRQRNRVSDKTCEKC